MKLESSRDAKPFFSQVISFALNTNRMLEDLLRHVANFKTHALAEVHRL